MIAYAFDQLGASALFAGHHPDNAVSARVLAHLEFQFTHDEFYPPTGQKHPSYLLMNPNRIADTTGEVQLPYEEP